MKRLLKLIAAPSVRPFVLLVALIVVFALADGNRARFLTASTGYSVLQQFATLGPIALALGLTMMMGEFDLSIGGMVTLGGCLAVLAGHSNPWLGLFVALLAGGLGGLIQAGIMLKLQLGSIGVTLGGLLTLTGIAYVITRDQTIGFTHMDVVMAMSNPIGAMFSVRSLIAITLFAVTALLISWTRWGRDTLAVGSDRRAALVAGVPVGVILVVVFAVCGVINAGAGALLSYSLAAASPVGLADTLAPAATAAIIGGVSLSGGKGLPLGIAGGTLVLCVLRAGLTVTGVSPHMQSIVTGLLLLTVAIADGDDLGRRIFMLRRALRLESEPAAIA